ncbi:MAG: aminotransferase class V-fold PLP-dependent enzyme, partial [Candidatus Cloacimonetes bacterium]|nr:aminotransferase class V-fold PLP-dependent enzyme [Candidatus Cloacimonadota bacterium]
GTVDFVTLDREHYIEDIETREKPGTPGIMQAIKVALVFQLKEKVGVKTIEEIEKYYLTKFYDYYKNNEMIQFYGPIDPDKKLNIIPFNIVHKDRVFHHKFITKLINDLFGIQTRAGCSCAGPYGHRLLDISQEISRYYQCAIGVDKYSGVKPGWVRLNFHYTLSEVEFDYIIKAIDFVIENADIFLQEYNFDFSTGDWFHVEHDSSSKLLNLDFESVINTPKYVQDDCGDCDDIFADKLEFANKKAAELKPTEYYPTFNESLENLMFFYVKNYYNLKGMSCGQN